MKYSVTALFLLAILGLAGVEVSAQKKPLTTLSMIRGKA